jgi:hypothetical protein
MIPASNNSVFDTAIIYNIPATATVVNPIIDSLSVPALMNSFLFFEPDLKNPKNYTSISFTNSYNFRPDRFALEIYGNQNLYPAILLCNNLCSILQFKAEALNFSVRIPTTDIINTILQKL